MRGWEHMLHAGAALVLAQQVDTRPPFWWIGLFASPGGLLIVAGVLAAVVVALFLVRTLLIQTGTSTGRRSTDRRPRHDA